AGPFVWPPCQSPPTDRVARARSHRHGSPRCTARGSRPGHRGAVGRGGDSAVGGPGTGPGGGGRRHRHAGRQCAGGGGGAGRRDPAGRRGVRASDAGNAGQVVGCGGGTCGRAGGLRIARAADTGRAGGGNAGLPPGFAWHEKHEAAALNPSTESIAATEPATGGSTEYINHHLHHLQVSVGDGAFMTLNVDTLFFTFVLGLLFVASFILCARRATAGVPGKFQAFVEIIVGFVDGLVRETFHGRSKLIAPLSLTIFILVFLMSFMDMVPVDLLPWAWASGYELAGHDPAHAYLRVVPTADLNTTFGMSLGVFLLIQVFGISHKGLGGFTKEIFTAPFHAHSLPMKIVLAPANLLLRVIEEG